VQLAARRELVQSLNVFEPVLKMITAQINFIFRDRVEHECVIRVRRMSERKYFGSVPHCRDAICQLNACNPRAFHCHLRYPSTSDNLSHMAKMAKTGLGKGLGALIGTRVSPPPSTAAATGEDVDLGEQIRRVGLSTIVRVRSSRGKILHLKRCRNWSIRFGSMESFNRSSSVASMGGTN